MTKRRRTRMPDDERRARNKRKAARRAERSEPRPAAAAVDPHVTDQGTPSPRA